MTRRRVGILGGTFDPIHYGHLRIASAVLSRLSLTSVVLIPNRQPPHKAGRHVTPAEDRLAMVRLAVRSNPAFSVDTLEMEREGPSYTYDTVTELRRRHPLWDMAFISGLDGFLDIRTWHRWQELLHLVTFVVINRPGYPRQQLDSFLAELGPSYMDSVRYLELPGVDISSSRIRERAEHGQSLAGLVPDAVAEYIARQRLYHEAP